MTDHDRAAIESAIESFRRAYDSGDLATLTGYYTEDLVKLRQGVPPETRSELARRIVETLRDFSGRLEVVNDEIEISGDMAYVRGSLMVELTHRTSGEKKTVRRRFLEIWRKVSGAWKVSRTMDNSGAE